VTVFGDAVAPHGGSIGLGNLIRLVEPLGLSERLTRTAMRRLTYDDWFQVKAMGRRSSYRLTEIGRLRLERGEQRIYAARAPVRDGRWCVVLLPLQTVSSRDREAARAQLEWQGFGTVAPNVLIHAGSYPGDTLRPLLEELGLSDGAVVLSAQEPPDLAGVADRAERSLRPLVQSAWDLRALAAGYRTFLRRFRPLLRILEAQSTDDPEACLHARVLLVEQYRRVLLRDPELPVELLPTGWPGEDARGLAAELYPQLWTLSQSYLCASAQSDGRPMPEAEPHYFRRFRAL
jgi:phenylacetic acid degradation operon negative regulatory protein